MVKVVYDHPSEVSYLHKVQFVFNNAPLVDCWNTVRARTVKSARATFLAMMAGKCVLPNDITIIQVIPVSGSGRPVQCSEWVPAEEAHRYTQREVA